MTLEISGKILETAGALLVAYVGVRVAWLELSVCRRLRNDPVASDLAALGERLRKIHNYRKQQFGFFEAMAVGLGTVLIAVGCALYLWGLIVHSH